MQFPIIVCLILYTHNCVAQIGVKTVQPVQTGNQINANERYEYDWYLGPTGQINTANGGVYPQLPSDPVLDARTQNFLNRTVTRMATGVCFKEVPTASLIGEGSANAVPRGNGSTSALSRIQVCCNGYQRNAHNLQKCDPICKNECINGLCVAPDECVCYPDHVRNYGGFCVATCPIGCSNGECNGNNCVCKPGYTHDVTRKFCAPVCNPGCGKGNCTAPNTCSCNNGYEPTEQGRCVPKCTHGCQFGECTAPEVCSCRAGYKLQGDKCTPVCQRGCVNGQCIAPNTCGCTVGYTLDTSGTKCEAKCDQPCLNGICNGPNRCSCNTGYVLDADDPNRCVPHCPNGCINGVCSGPGFCICHAGFVKDRSVKGSQACVRRQ